MVISIIVIALVVVLDQASKLIVVSSLALGESFDVIPGVFKITYIHNDGAAFGMLDDHRWIFMVVSSVAILAILVYLFKFAPKNNLMRVGLSLVVGGGIGNMIDRVALGYVVDFIDFCAFDFWVWIFNVADACVCVGGGIVILYFIIDMVKEEREKKAAKAALPESNTEISGNIENTEKPQNTEGSEDKEEIKEAENEDNE